MTSAPSAVKREAIPLDCFAARVTTKRLPESGKFFFHARDLPSSTTPPIIVMAGAVTCSRTMVSPAVSSVAITVRWNGVVPFSIKASGVFGSLPHSIRRCAIKSILPMPIKKMSVPGQRARDSKSSPTGSPEKGSEIPAFAGMTESLPTSNFLLSTSFSCPVTM